MDSEFRYSTKKDLDIFSISFERGEQPILDQHSTQRPFEEIYGPSDVTIIMILIRKVIFL